MISEDKERYYKEELIEARFKTVSEILQDSEFFNNEKKAEYLKNIQAKLDNDGNKNINYLYVIATYYGLNKTLDTLLKIDKNDHCSCSINKIAMNATLSYLESDSTILNESNYHYEKYKDTLVIALANIFMYSNSNSLTDEIEEKSQNNDLQEEIKQIYKLTYNVINLTNNTYSLMYLESNSRNIIEELKSRGLELIKEIQESNVKTEYKKLLSSCILLKVLLRNHYLNNNVKGLTKAGILDINFYDKHRSYDQYDSFVKYISSILYHTENLEVYKKRIKYLSKLSDCCKGKKAQETKAIINRLFDKIDKIDEKLTIISQETDNGKINRIDIRKFINDILDTEIQKSLAKNSCFNNRGKLICGIAFGSSAIGLGTLGVCTLEKTLNLSTKIPSSFTIVSKGLKFMGQNKLVIILSSLVIPMGIIIGVVSAIVNKNTKESLAENPRILTK